MPGDSGVTVVTMLVCLFLSHTRLRVHRAPGIPCALCYQRGETVFAKLGPSAPRDRGGATSLRGATRRSNPFFLGAAPWIASLVLAMTVSRRAPRSYRHRPA